MMRSFALPAVLVAMVAVAPMAFAAATTDGTIKAFDMKAMTLTLETGTVYHLPSGFKDPGLKVGEKVAVIWEMNGAAYDASGVTIMK